MVDCVLLTVRVCVGVCCCGCGVARGSVVCTNKVLPVMGIDSYNTTAVHACGMRVRHKQRIWIDCLLLVPVRLVRFGFGVENKRLTKCKMIIIRYI